MGWIRASLVAFSVTVFGGCDDAPPDVARTPQPEAAEPRGTPVVHVPGAVIGTGPVPKEVIDRVIGRHREQIWSCYETGMRREPELAGRVTVKWVIQTTGAVEPVTIASSTLNDAEVEACMAEAIRGWRFPPAQGGGSVEVSYPFELRPR